MNRKFRLGIIGHPIGHTLSPVMHKAAGAANGIEIDYDPYDIAPEDLGSFFNDLRSSGIDGLNVTVPHKVAVMEHMDDLTGQAGSVGAVNTIINNDGVLVGDNTDGYGFLTAVRENADTSFDGKKIFIFGAGGAARAIAHAVAGQNDVEITIANRTQSKAKDIADNIGPPCRNVKAISYDSGKLVDYVGTADIIVNTTSVGMEGAEEGPLPGIESISGRQLVVDIVYRPLQTRLLEHARSAGAKTLDGLWMLIHQGAKSFRLWTGCDFPVAEARNVLLEELNNSES